MITHFGCWENTRKACKSLLHNAGVSLRLSEEPPCITSLGLVIYKLRPTESVFCCLNIPEACWKRYPFSSEPPCIGHYRAYPPLGLIITPAETLHAMGIWDNLEGRNPPRRVGEEVIKSQEPSLPLPQSGLLSHCNSFVFHLTPHPPPPPRG